MTEITQGDVGLYISRCTDEAELAELNQMLVMRMKVLRKRQGQQIMRDLAVGDYVRFIDTVKPTYLQGRRAKVIEFRQTKMTVELVDGPVGKFRSGKVIVPPAILRKIAPPRVFTEVTAPEDED